MLPKTFGIGMLIGLLLGVMLMTDYPDWTIPTNITNSQLDVYITNSTMDVRVVDTTITFTVQPAQNAVFYIEPTTSAVFNIQGDVNATIQGTASISIDNATITIDVATIKEKVEKQGNMFTLNDYADIPSGNYVAVIDWTNDLGIDVFLEMVGGYTHYSTLSDTEVVAGLINYNVLVYDGGGNRIFAVPSDYHHLPLTFDPALKVRNGWRIKVLITNESGNTVSSWAWVLLSYR